MSLFNDGDVTVFKDKNYTRGYRGHFITHQIDVSSIEIEVSYFKNENGRDWAGDYLPEDSPPTLRSLDFIKGKAIIPPLYNADSWDKKLVEEVSIIFFSDFEVVKKASEYVEALKNEFKTDNNYEYRFESKNIVGYSNLHISEFDSGNSNIQIHLDYEIYEILQNSIKENKLSDISIEIEQYSVFTETSLEFGDKVYGCVIEQSISDKAFGVVKEIIFKENNIQMEAGKSFLLEKNNVQKKEEIDKLSQAFGKTIDDIRFNVKIGFIVIGIMVFISLFF
jgi:hypothetical protein